MSNSNSSSPRATNSISINTSTLIAATEQFERTIQFERYLSARVEYEALYSAYQLGSVSARALVDSAETIALMLIDARETVEHQEFFGW
jgi:hypothetical protein